MTKTHQFLPLLRRFAMVLTALFSLLQTAHGAPIWQVEGKQGNKLLIAGTVHLLRPVDLPLPEEYQLAFSSSDQLVFEADIGELKQPDVQLAMAKLMILPPGKTLADYLSAETYQRLTQAMTRFGLPVEGFKQVPAGMVSLTLSLQAMASFGYTEQGIDERFYQRAIKAGKPVSGLESVDYNIAMLKELGVGYEEQMIVATLADLADMELLHEQVHRLWRYGDFEVAKPLIERMQREAPELYQSLLVERNLLWLEQLEQMLLTPEQELVMVGAMHLPESEGLIEQLKLRGYKVQPYSGE